MGHINRCDADVLLKALKFRPHVDPQFRIEVAERLVHEEDLRLPYDGSTDRHSLALSAAELSRFTSEERLDLQELRRSIHPLDDLAFRDLSVLQGKRKILVHGHVRIQGIALEHHRDVPIFRLQVIHEAVPNVNLALGWRL